MDKNRLLMTPEEVLKRCDENTIGVVPTLGVTFTGEFEPVAAVSRALDELQQDTGLDIPIHVDGASGGFLAPFCGPDLVWDFRLPRVKSINASGHKFGLAPLGVGWVIWREEQDLVVWTPDMIGSALFLASGYLAVVECRRSPGAWRPTSVAWWIVVINLLGCVAFMISAVLAFTPATPLAGATTLATGFTTLGATAFLAGSLLLLPQPVIGQ
jgi:hypothetical protein